jgi:hypothetical protein
MDVIIVGTGASALLLARSLVERGDCARIRIIGPRAPFAAHALSFWNDTPTPFDPFTVASYGQVEVVSRTGDRSTAVLNRHRYRVIHARGWAERLFAELSAQGVEHIPMTVDGWEDGTFGAAVFAGGQRLQADWVFASGGPGALRPDAWQRFVGWEIEVDHDLDLRTARLLDFRTDSEGDFRFMYALPLDRGRLHVVHVSHEQSDHKAALERYLREVVGATQWRVLHDEHGATPLYRLRPERGEHHIVRIGVSAGLAKACTGYALTRMWRDAARISDALARRGDPYAGPTLPSLYRLSDEVFLERLKHDPHSLESLLSALFGSASGDSVLSFLDERADLPGQLEVARVVSRWIGRRAMLQAAP